MLLFILNLSLAVSYLCLLCAFYEVIGEGNTIKQKRKINPRFYLVNYKTAG